MGQTKLRETYRLAMNVQEGYEVLVDCGQCKGSHWVRVASALHILAPLPLSSFTVDGHEPCVPQGAWFTRHPRASVMSRRPAGA